jgi:hypothetical protein
MRTNKTRALLLSSSIAVSIVAVLMLGLAAGAAQAKPLAQAGSKCDESETTIAFQGVTEDNGEYTWSYTVCQTGYALSHWVLGLCPCFSETNSIVEVGYDDGSGAESIPECNGEDGPCWSLGYDPTTMLYGLKWDNLGEGDEELDEGECWTFYLIVNQDLAEETLDWTSKYDACEPGTGTVTGPACPCDQNCGQIRAFKYYDYDQSAAYDNGDYPLQGWAMTLISDTTEVASGTTDEFGIVDFGCVPSDTYTVCETLQVGWSNSDPGGVVATPPVSVCEQVTVNAGDQKQVDFGNYQPESDKANIRGFKYEDVDGDGAYDETVDNPLNDWEICLESNGCKDTQDIPGLSGGYTPYWEVDPGTYTLCETLEQDWVNSDPGDGTLCKSVTVAAGEFKTLEFGNYISATKSGMKFEDFNGNGVMDGDDIPLEDWTIYLDGTDGAGDSVDLETETDANGMYSFTVPPGSYVVCEELPTPWNQTFPTSGADCSGHGSDYGYQVTLSSGDDHPGNDFGNDPQLPEVRGCKYHDLDGEGDFDQGEPVLSGWEICLQGDGEDCKFTQEADGCTEPWYVQPGSSYELCEKLKEGWENTDPGDGLCKTTGQLASGDEETLYFGNFQPAPVGGATVAPRGLETLVQLAVIGLAGLLAAGAGLILWRRKAT